MNGQFWWYVARAGGLVAWLLAGAAVLAHLAAHAAPERRLALRLAAQRGFLEVLTLTMAALHGVGVLADGHGPAAGLSASEALVPFGSSWETGALTWGVVAFAGAILAVVVPAVARRHPAGTAIGRWASVVVFAAATVHALALPGTDLDRGVSWWTAAVLGALLVAVALTGARRGTDSRAADTDDHDTDADGSDDELRIEHVEEPAPRGAEPVRRDLAPTVDTTPAAPSSPVAPGAPLVPRPVPAARTGGVDGPSLDVLERARARLASLDTDAYPQTPVPDELLTQRPAPPVERTDPAPRLTPMPLLAPPPAVRRPGDAPAVAAPVARQSGPAEPNDDRTSRRVFAPLEAAPPGEPATGTRVTPPEVGAPTPATRAGDDPAAGGDVALRYARLRNRRGMLTPSDPPQPSRPAAPADGDAAAPAWFEVGSRPLPRRAPQPVAATTAAATPGEWAPRRQTVTAAGPPPPPEPDPTTGEVPPEAYRVWLREWLAYAESYDG